MFIYPLNSSHIPCMCLSQTRDPYFSDTSLEKFESCVIFEALYCSLSRIVIGRRIINRRVLVKQPDLFLFVYGIEVPEEPLHDFLSLSVIIYSIFAIEGDESLYTAKMFHHCELRSFILTIQNYFIEHVHS